MILRISRKVPILGSSFSHSGLFVSEETKSKRGRMPASYSAPTYDSGTLTI